jgi:myo-inositol-1(or 4)-monophosphatase
MDLLSFIESTARDAGSLLRKHFGAAVASRTKSGREIVTDLDSQSERIIVGEIQSRFPGHAILSEESYSSVDRSAFEEGELWIIDPIDGTANFARGISLFCVAIAHLSNGRPVAAVVFDPVHDEMFSMEHSSGATLNGKPVSVSETGDLLQALVATGFPYERPEGLDNTDHVAALVPKISDLRRTGSGLLDLAYVACGRYDAYFEHALPPWDTAAGWALVTAAGGRVTRYDGAQFRAQDTALCASNGLIHNALLEVLQLGASGLIPAEK